MFVSDDLKKRMESQHRTTADIVIEVLSKATAVYDQNAKADTYHAMRVRELWLVDTDAKQIEVRSFESGKNAICKYR
jgi:Uma2 family endonuclease